MKKMLLIASAAFVFVACKDRSKDVNLTQPGGLAGQLNTSQSSAGKTTLPSLGSTSTAGLNPEHGQPGHRCDLGVGAPLPGAATTQASNALPAPQVIKTETPITVPPVTVNPVTASNTTTTAKPSGNLNPAHGQPGHRCDISVGAPLSSAPAVKTNNTVQNVSVQPVPNSTTSITPTAPGMNPQHGQPGHRCDIAVGAPLNSAPSKVEGKVDSTGKN